MNFRRISIWFFRKKNLISQCFQTSNSKKLCLHLRISTSEDVCNLFRNVTSQQQINSQNIQFSRFNDLWSKSRSWIDMFCNFSRFLQENTAWRLFLSGKECFNKLQFTRNPKNVIASPLENYEWELMSAILCHVNSKAEQHMHACWKTQSVASTIVVGGTNLFVCTAAVFSGDFTISIIRSIFIQFMLLRCDDTMPSRHELYLEVTDRKERSVFGEATQKINRIFSRINSRDFRSRLGPSLEIKTEIDKWDVKPDTARIVPSLSVPIAFPLPDSEKPQKLDFHERLLSADTGDKSRRCFYCRWQQFRGQKSVVTMIRLS